MRLYIRTDGSYAGTQADAGKGRAQVEVPTDKAGLIDYLNGLEARQTPAERDSAAPATQTTPEPPRRFSARPKPDDGADAIGDWLYHHASSSEVYDVFMCLAARFGHKS